jgi:hypothetical protein
MPDVLFGNIYAEDARDVLLDRAGNILFLDRALGYVYRYSPPYHGIPSVFPMRGDLFYCVFGRVEAYLYCADRTTVDVYKYPTLQHSYSYSKGLDPNWYPTGIANAPAAPPTGGLVRASERRGVPAPVPQQTRIVKRASTHYITYLGIGDAETVRAYPEINRSNKPPLCQIKNVYGVAGIAVDSSSNLWATSIYGKVYEYSPLCGALKKTLRAGASASDIAFDSKGNAYVLSVNKQLGVIRIYAKGSTKPTRVLRDPDFLGVRGVTVDAGGDVFVTYSHPLAPGLFIGGLAEFVQATMPARHLTNVVIAKPGRPLFDGAGNLIVSDLGIATLHVYAPPYTGTPTDWRLRAPSSCALGQTEQRIYCAAAYEVDVYDYPLVRFRYSYSNGLSPSSYPVSIANAPN